MSQITEFYNTFIAAREAYEEHVAQTFPRGSQISYDGPFGGRVRDTVSGYGFDDEGERILETRNKDYVHPIKSNVKLIVPEAN